MKSVILLGIVALVVLSFSVSGIYAQEEDITTQYTQLTGITSIEVTTVPLVIPENNSLPWGYVEGKINNPVSGYPVIIQFFQDGDAVHFAQTDVNQDDSYEYKFRVLNNNDKILDGTYEIKIFKVVYTIPENSA